MYDLDSVLNNPQGLISHKTTKSNQTLYSSFFNPSPPFLSAKLSNNL